MPLDLLIRNARLPRQERLTDIGIQDGVFTRIAPHVRAAATEELDAGGRLVSPPLVDCHVHLDAVLTVGQPRHNATGTLLEGIQIWSERKPSLTHEDVKQRATEAIKWEVAQGTLFIRSHVDVCDPNLTALRALIEVQREVVDICELQLVAFPQDGILSFPNGKELMDEAMRLGANVVGGIPHHEWTREMGVEDVHYAFELARRYNRDVDCHCDETDDAHSRFTEVMAADALQQGWEGRATVSHCTAMHSWDNAYAFKAMRLLARGRLNVICNPYDNITLQGRFDSYPKRRGMARLKELLLEVWPQIRSSPATLILLNGAWSAAPEIHGEVLHLARNHHVVLADVRTPDLRSLAEKIKSPGHVITLAGNAEPERRIRLEVAAV